MNLIVIPDHNLNKETLIFRIKGVPYFINGCVCDEVSRVLPHCIQHGVSEEAGKEVEEVSKLITKDLNIHEVYSKLKNHPNHRLNLATMFFSDEPDPDLVYSETVSQNQRSFDDFCHVLSVTQALGLKTMGLHGYKKLTLVNKHPYLERGSELVHDGVSLNHGYFYAFDRFTKLLKDMESFTQPEEDLEKHETYLKDNLSRIEIIILHGLSLKEKAFRQVKAKVVVALKEFLDKNYEPIADGELDNILLDVGSISPSDYICIALTDSFSNKTEAFKHGINNLPREMQIELAVHQPSYIEYIHDITPSMMEEISNLGVNIRLENNSQNYVDAFTEFRAKVESRAQDTSSVFNLQNNEGSKITFMSDVSPISSVTFPDRANELTIGLFSYNNRKYCIVHTKIWSYDNDEEILIRKLERTFSRSYDRITVHNLGDLDIVEVIHMCQLAFVSNHVPLHVKSEDLPKIDITITRFFCALYSPDRTHQDLVKYVYNPIRKGEAYVYNIRTFPEVLKNETNLSTKHRIEYGLWKDEAEHIALIKKACDEGINFGEHHLEETNKELLLYCVRSGKFGHENNTLTNMYFHKESITTLTDEEMLEVGLSNRRFAKQMVDSGCVNGERLRRVLLRHYQSLDEESKKNYRDTMGIDTIPSYEDEYLFWLRKDISERFFHNLEEVVGGTAFPNWNVGALIINRFRIELVKAALDKGLFDEDTSNYITQLLKRMFYIKG